MSATIPAQTRTLEVPETAIPAVLAVLDALRASASPPGAEPFRDRLALTLPESAQALGLSVATVRSLLRRGDLTSISFGRATRILVTELTKYLERRSDEAQIWTKPVALRRQG